MATQWDYFIDASTSNTGITLVSPSKIICSSVNFSKILPKPSSYEKAEQHVEKLKGIRDILEEFTTQFPPTSTLHLEGIFVQPKFLNSSEVLLKLHGFLIGYFIEHEFEYYPPSIIKQAITGKGNSAKQVVQTALANKYGVTFQDFDQSDSLAVYEYWRLIHQQPYRPIDEIFQWEPKEPLKGRTSNATTKSIQSISESGL